MIIEYLVIFAIMLVLVIIYSKSNKKYAIATIPLLVLPGTNIIAYLLSDSIASLLPFEHITVYTVMNLLAVMVSTLLVGIWSARFKRRSTKIGYVSMCLLFNIILALIFIYNQYILIYPQ